MEIGRIRSADSPRLAGVNAEHVRLIAEAVRVLPPIVVHRETMQVIDGMHRLRAAVLRGDTRIGAYLFEGSRESAFIYSVRANNAHGLPLTSEDRRAAASRLLVTRPEWSDRFVAEVVGLSAGTVAAVRRSTAQRAQLNGRIGKDGRYRPASTAEGRRRAAELLESGSGASLREIAREVGLSLGTVADVRRRLQQGDDPVRARRTGGPNAPGAGSGGPAGEVPVSVREVNNRMDALGRDASHSWQQLSRDPSLRHSEKGRYLLRLLSTYRINLDVIKAIPEHRKADVAMVARQCSSAWMEFSRLLEADT